MNKVYLVGHYSYDHNTVVAVCSNREAAEREFYKVRSDIVAEIEEWLDYARRANDTRTAQKCIVMNDVIHLYQPFREEDPAGYIPRVPYVEEREVLC